MHRTFSFFHKITVLVVLFGLGTPAFAVGKTSAPTSLTEDQKILHVLSRLTYGARRGDLERVRAIGLQKFIDRQLDPLSISDTVVENKVKRLEVFGMSTAQIFAKYPNPGALLRQLGENVQAAGSAMPDDDADRAVAQRQRQQKLQKLYREYDLKRAGQIDPQIVANRVLRAAYSERQLQEVMVDFWQNHFNVYSRKGAVRWYIPSYERDVLRKNALGNFRDLVVGTAQHPAMLFFLDNFQSVTPQTNAGKGGGMLQRHVRNGTLTAQMRERIKERQGLTDAELDERIERLKKQQTNRQQRGINENYARELMELHTLGVDGGYTQNDIVEVAKAFTGWTIADARGYRSAAADEIKGVAGRRLARIRKQAGVPDDIESGEFYFNPNTHAGGVKTVLGQKVNEGGINDGLKVIDILVKHPSTAKFIARKLAVKFVSDKPSDALVGRVAEAFQRSDGDIKTTLKAIFSDKEFFAAENYRSKIKTPFELAVSSVRALGAETNSSPAFLAMLRKLGEVPYGYQAPTGYPDTAEDWVNTGALLERLNFAVAIASNRIPGTKVDLKAYDGLDRSQILDRAIGEVLEGEVSASTKATLRKQLEQPLPEVTAGSADDDEGEAEMPEMASGRRGMNRRVQLLAPSGKPEVFKVVSLVLGTPEFQRQ